MHKSSEYTAVTPDRSRWDRSGKVKKRELFKAFWRQMNVKKFAGE